MLGRSQTVTAVPKAAAVPKKVAATKTFTMSALWRLTVWGATASCALLVVVLASRSQVGAQRAGVVLSSLRGASPLLPGDATQPPAARSFDTEAETRRLEQTVRGLAAENNQIKSRVAAVEHNMDDVTGSISRQIEAVKTEVAAPWPADKASEPTSPAVIAAVVTPVVPTNPLTPPAASSTRAKASQGYGADIGSALSIQVLRARWAGIRSAHPKLFEGLQPVVTLREIARTNRTELRLVVGPFASTAAAAELCASLTAYRLYCQPTTFDGQHLALE